ncbi:MAG TPA: allantoicase [Nocardioidaceae bacterium]|nr:allantoicase [Nocardioidaceae bacterium]
MADDFKALPDLASRLLGGSVVHADDDFFAARENLVSAGAPEHDPAAFGLRGKVYDGWETRRRREPGDDTAVIRLGVPGVVEGVVVDTSWFTGNFPPHVSVAATELPGYPKPDEVLGSDWTPLLSHVAVQGDAANEFAVDLGRRFTHVRLTLHPDGGVARLRVHGTPVPDPALLAGTVDLAALEHGGDVVACSDMYYAAARNLLLPGRARSTAEGWENARRRGGGNDFVTVRLAGAGVVRRVVVDTSCFVGNAPDSVSVRGADSRTDDLDDPGGWLELVPRTRVQPDTRHQFPVDQPRPVTHVRLDVFPDGGLARLRVLGELESLPTLGNGRGLGRLNRLDEGEASTELRAVCAATSWVRGMLAARPYASVEALLATSDQLVATLDDEGLAEALAAHARIGERRTGGSREDRWSRTEQAAALAAGEDLQPLLEEGNREYERRFGRVFLIRAAGRSAREMYDAQRARLGNDEETERAVVLGELAAIVRLRLEGMVDG